jgi:glycerophosphoryl diester phosphodiesterase
MDRRNVIAGLGMSVVAGCATRPAPQRAKPLIIAHRGASAYRPEHTLSAYRLAIAMGADFIEPDLVLTKDGVLVCRHENQISGTTDVAARPEFADRKRKKTVDWDEVEGWFTEDFTLAELKTLRCKERLPQLRPASAAFDGQEAIATFEEVIALAQAEGVRLRRTIGVYPETKHPTYFEGLGLSFDAPLIAALGKAGWGGADAPVFIQSFETGNLKRLSQKTSVRLVQLISDGFGMPFDHLPTGMGVTYQMMTSDTGLKEIARYAAGIGPHKGLILPRDGEGRTLPATDLVARAHAARLKVHPWTLRAENYFLPLELRRGDPAAPDFQRQHGAAQVELETLFLLGVDGVFTDFPDRALQARDNPGTAFNDH